MPLYSRLTLYAFLFVGFILSPVCSSIADPKLKAGIALPLSGIAAEYGDAYRRGIEMALADRSQERELLTLIYEDHKYDNKSAVSAVRKLANLDKVQLAAVWGWAPSDALAPLSKELKIPLLLSSINSVSRGRANVLNLASPLGHLLRPLAEHIAQKGYKKITFITTPVGALEQSAPEMRTMLPAEVSSTQLSVATDANDFRTILTKMKSDPPDVLAAFLLPGQLRVLVEQARALNVSVPIIGENTFNDALVTELFKDLEAGPVFVDWFIDPAFVKRLVAGQSHNVEVAQGYFLGNVLLEIARGVPAPFEGAAVMKFLRFMPPGKGPAGEYQIVDSPEFGPHVVFPSVLNQISQGKVRAM